ncbi:oxidoreductase [Mollisia scopiformis]|uniref:Oxidoreductase n=1 Tax=Mollisia scopiformis TaxID=149040 RepID=A0A194XHX6_MOLSC|nr:oxidoreductase [Mollisia scopiformis]KUJ19729.1 oxidoreductase [Mollisia scopiformis]
MPFRYNPDKDIPDLSGKVFLVTGGNSGTAGVGKEALIQLSKHNPKRIYFTGRNTSSANTLIASLQPTFNNLTFIPMDQTSLTSVSEGAKLFLEKSEQQLDVLICNAGVMAIPLGLSKDGYEIQFAVNHLAHALLINLCLPALRKSGEGRIVLLTSLAFKSAPSNGGIVFKDLKSTQANLGISLISFSSKFLTYGQSKLANVLYASQLAKRYPDITTIAVHPGLVMGTSLTGHMGLLDKLVIRGATLKLKNISVREGAFNTLWAATKGKGEGMRSGEVYEPVGKRVEGTKFSMDERLQEELWGWTERELGGYS